MGSRRLSASFATAFAFSAWQTGISRNGASRVLLCQYLIPVTGVASGIIVFDETPRSRRQRAGRPSFSVSTWPDASEE